MEVCIPGSLEIKMYNIQGQPYKATEEDYERAYFSSILRTLYKTECQKMRVYNQVCRCNVLKSFVFSFVPFCFSK